MDDDEDLSSSKCDYGEPGEKLCKGEYFQPAWCCGNRQAIGIPVRFLDPEMST